MDKGIRKGLILWAGALSLFISGNVMATSAIYTTQPVTVDGIANDNVWRSAKWHDLSHDMIDNQPASDDFRGRFKLAWDEGHLYLLAEIVDDVLWDSHPDPLVKYWDDDCLEVFLDEDASGGNHLANYNAFAYHIALDGNVADMGNTAAGENKVVLLNDHVKSRWARSATKPYTITWELAIDVYNDSFLVSEPGEPVSLSAGKVMGFMLAYCDNDGSKEREHFMGSQPITPRNGDRNLGYIDASVFGKVTLVK